jgi:hypothetical protein
MSTVDLITRLQSSAADMWELVMRHHDELKSLQGYYERAVTVEERNRIEREMNGAESNVKVTMRSYGLIMKNIEELCTK